MLQPKRTKHRKMFHIRHDKVVAHRNNTVAFGEFGLKSTSSAWISARQIEAARIAITRHMGREGKVIIKIFPHMSKLVNLLVFVWDLVRVAQINDLQS